MKHTHRHIGGGCRQDLHLRRDPERALALVEPKHQRRAATDGEAIGDTDLDERHQELVDTQIGLATW